MKNKVKGQYRKDAKEQGIALTVMLVVLMFAATLTFGTLFLTQNNLKVAENIRNHAIAKYNAEAGIEVSHIMLGETWKETGIMPTTDTVEAMVPLAVSASETEFSYYLDPEVFNSTSNNVYLAIIGKSGPDASYQSEMLANAIAASTGQTRLLPAYTHGILSKEHVTMNQLQGTDMTSAGVHGNQGFILHGHLDGIVDCVEYFDDGKCKTTAEPDDKSKYFTGAFEQSSYECREPNGEDLCHMSKPRNLVIDPFNPWTADGNIKNPQPALINSRASLLLGLIQKEVISARELKNLGYLSDSVDLDNVTLSDLADTNRDGVFNYDDSYGPVDAPIDLTLAVAKICTGYGINYYDGAVPIHRSRDLFGAGFRSGKTICVGKASGIQFPRNSDLSDMTIINLNGELRALAGTTLENTTLVNLDASQSLILNEATGSDTLIYAKGNLVIDKTSEMGGETTLLTSNDFKFSGQAHLTETDEGPAVGVSAIAEGNLTYDKDTTLHGIYLTRGQMTISQNADIKGSLVADKEIIFQKSITAIDSSLPVINGTLAVSEGEYIEAGFKVMGRR